MTVVIGYSVGTSSNLSEIGYEPASREFYVRFRNGGQGAYSGVEIEDACQRSPQWSHLMIGV